MATNQLSGKRVAIITENGFEEVELTSPKKALEEAGATMEDVVRTRMFVTDISHWEEIGRAHGEVFRTIKPASTMVQVSALINPEHLIEIEATALLSAEHPQNEGFSLR